MNATTYLMNEVTGRRCGAVLPSLLVPATPADIPNLFNVSVPSSTDPMDGRAGGGGIGWDLSSARNAAIGEALERYAAATVQLETRCRDELREPSIGPREMTLFNDAQIRDFAFPYPFLYAEDLAYTDTYDIITNERVWLPAPLMALDLQHNGVATSSGVAAAPTTAMALLRGLQELIERDAMMATWLHQVKGRRVPMPDRYTAAVVERGGTVVAIDATPAYSSHPVAIIIGNLPRRGIPRPSMGASCRDTWEAAVDKAYLEWVQGTMFIGERIHRGEVPTYRSTADVRTFDDHALYYTNRYTSWEQLPIFAGPTTVAPPPSQQAGAPAAAQFTELASALKRSNIRAYYRNLTTSDMGQIGLRVIRLVSPDLIPVHHDHRYPHLGGNASNYSLRYPWWSGEASFPSPYPHALG